MKPSMEIIRFDENDVFTDTITASGNFGDVTITEKDEW